MTLALLAGCGDTTVSVTGATLHVALTDYHLTPQRTVMRAGPVTIVVHNYGRLTHNLAVSVNGQTTDTTSPIWPGASAEMTLSLVPGTYLLASSLLSDQALGQYGTLKVVADLPRSAGAQAQAPKYQLVPGAG